MSSDRDLRVLEGVSPNVGVTVGKSAELPKTMFCRDGSHPCDGGIGLQQSASYRIIRRSMSIGSG